MFEFVVKYLRPLKYVPILPHVFDSLLKIGIYWKDKKLLNYFDEIEEEVASWQNTSVSTHRFGGLQFNANKKEIGHVHGNGLLDVLLSRKQKIELMEMYPIKNHHIFKDSGWVSFLVQTERDKLIAIEVLRYAYQYQIMKATATR